MALTELFPANLATTTVSSGGTNAPSSGTSQTWTVASSAMFGAAATGASQFHIADIASGKGTEIIAVTNVSGTTWTVTRGAEGTIPVTHSAGFTVYQVASAGWLSWLAGGAGGAENVFYVDNYGADPTGTSLSDSAFTAAYAAAAAAIVPSVGGGPTGGALVVFGAGVYKFSVNTVKVTDPRIGLIGPGSQACTLYTTGNTGDLVYVTDTSPGRSGVAGAAPVGGFQLFGWNSGSATNGFHFGDRSGSAVRDIYVAGFNGDDTCRGFLFRNDNGGLCEGNFVQVNSNQNSVCYDFDGSSANGSFDYGTYFLGLVATAISPNVAGFRLVNQGHMFGAFLRVQGNAANTRAGRTITCIQVGSSGSDTARLTSQVAIAIECDASTATVKDVVVTGASSAAGITQCSGEMLFLNAAGSFTAGSVGGSAVVTGWGTWAGPLFSSHGTLTALGSAAAGLSTYSG